MTLSVGAFFDWASTSPLCREAWEAQRACLDSCFAETNAPRWHREEIARLDTLRESLRTFLGAPSNAVVVLARSVSELMSMLACGFRRPDRDQVLLASNCHPAALLPWLPQRDVHTRLVEQNNDIIDLDSLSAALTENVLAVVVSHVTHRAGRLQPVDAVVDAASQVGAHVFVDGAQAVGRLPVKLRSWDGVMYLGSGRKALMAPMGTAFLAAEPSLLQNVEPLIKSPRSSQLAGSHHGQTATHAGLPAALEGNLPDLAALAGLHAAVRVARKRDPDELLVHMRQVTATFIKAISQALDLAVVDGHHGILQLHLSSEGNGLHLQQAVYDEGFVVAASDDALRISAHHPNTIDDALRLAGVIVSTVEHAA